MTDLIVVGGGPAGLATALHAARAGLEVALHEPRRGPVDKACGEGLMPGAVAALQELGVDPAGRELTGIRYLDGESSAEADFRGGCGRGVRRTTLHAALHAAVREAGVTLEASPVGRVTQDRFGIVADGRRARYLVAADGLHSPTRRALGLDGPPARRRRYGLRRHVQMAPWTSHVEVHWSPTGEAYVTPVAEDQVGIAVLSAERGPFEARLRQFPALRERLAGHASGEVLGAGPLRQSSTRRTAGRVLLVGDAAGYVDALTGEGVALGLAQAREAVRSLLADDPASYEARWRAVTRRYRLLTWGLLGTTRWPPARRALVPAAGRFPAVFDRAVGALARPA